MANKETEWVNMYDKADSELEPFNFQGGVATADFKMGLDFYKRDVFLQQKFLEITSIKNLEGREHKAFDTPYSGYLGIAPWTANPAEKEQNFLWQLKTAKMIDHMTMSFFVHLDDDNFPNSPSTIKFGGWDKMNTYTGGQFGDMVPIKFIRTIDEKSWDVKFS